MKKKFLQFTLALAAAIGEFMGLGWSFFALIVSNKQKQTPSRRRWFQLSHTRINHPRHRFEREYEEGKAWCRAQRMRDCYIQSHDGLRLHASFLPARDAERIVLLSHGYKGSGFGDFANIARFLHENGCHLLFIDQRCCGESEGDYITFGAKEQYDILGWLRFLSRRNRHKLPVYLYGESMGAASILMTSGHPLPPEVRGLIADCGFTSMRRALGSLAADWFHLHWIQLLLLRVDFFCRLLGGFRMRDADTAPAMQTNRLPVLFFHGALDTYVQPQNTLDNYSMCRAPKELVIVPNARHLCSAYVDPELYRRKLLQFFRACEASSDV